MVQAIQQNTHISGSDDRSIEGKRSKVREMMATFADPFRYARSDVLVTTGWAANTLLNFYATEQHLRKGDYLEASFSFTLLAFSAIGTVYFANRTKTSLEKAKKEEFSKERTQIAFMNAFNLAGMGKIMSARTRLKSINYTIEDVQKFIYLLDDDPRCGDSGIFVSALLNRTIGEKDVFELHMGRKHLNYIGSHLRRGTLIIHGSVGYRLGYKMLDGRLVLDDPDGHYSGRAGQEKRGGEIYKTGPGIPNMGYSIIRNPLDIMSLCRT